MPHIMKQLLQAAFVVLFLQSAPATAQNHAGTYRNAQMTIVLRAQGARYSGHIQLGGQQLPLTARTTGPAALQGTYSFQGQNYPFEATITNGEMTLTSEGTVYILTQQQAAAGPLAGGKSASAPAGKNEIIEKYHGIRFRVPKGWIAQKNEAGYVFGSKTEKGIMLMVPHEFNSLDVMRQEARNGIIDEGTALSLQGALTPFGKNGLAAKYSGTMQGQQATTYGIGLLSPFGGGVTILIAVETASYSNKYQKVAEALAKSVQFFKPEVPPVADEWKQRLNNSRLTYMWSYYSGTSVDGSYAGGSQRTQIDLCAQGYFRYSDSNQMSIDGGYGSGYNVSGYDAGRDKGQGSWEVVGRGEQAVLLLKFNDGRVFEYTLGLEDGKTYLNGKRFFRTYSNAPVEDHRPNCW